MRSTMVVLSFIGLRRNCASAWLESLHRGTSALDVLVVLLDEVVSSL